MIQGSNTKFHFTDNLGAWRHNTEMPKEAHITASPETKSNVGAFEGVTPLLRVADLAASVAYYVRSLGFNLNWKCPLRHCRR